MGDGADDARECEEYEWMVLTDHLIGKCDVHDYCLACDSPEDFVPYTRIRSEIRELLLGSGLSWRSLEKKSIHNFVNNTRKEYMVPKKHAFWNPSSSDLWLNCDEYAKHKKENPRASTAGAAALRGTALHDVLESLLHSYIEIGAPMEQNGEAFTLAAKLEEAIGKAEEANDYTVTDDDREQIEIAFNAVLDVAAPYGDEAQFLIEASVPLEHEPESVGTIDFAIIVRSQNLLFVIDHKMGQGEVDAFAPQLKIYAANLIPVLEEKIGWRPTRVVLGVNQPALYREVGLFPTTADDLQHWYRGSVLPIVARQKAGQYTHGAQSLEVCDKFCPFQQNCAVRADLVRKALGLVEQTTLSVEEKEYLARNRSAFEKILKEIHTEVIGDATTWPNWKRWHVQNARSWNEAIGQDEIAHSIRLKLADPSAEIYSLKTPAAIKQLAPEVAEVVDECSIDNGYHVRARYGAPQTAEVEAPPKRETKAKAPAKKATVKTKASTKKPAKAPAERAATKKSAAKARGKKK